MRQWAASGKAAKSAAGQTEAAPATSAASVSTSRATAAPSPASEVVGHRDDIFEGYLSDLEADDDDLATLEEGDGYENESEAEDNSHTPGNTTTQPFPPPEAFHIHKPPPAKRRKLEIPVRTARMRDREARKTELEEAKKALSKMLKSKKDNVFDGGPHGLQASRARLIESLLVILIKGGRGWMDASEMAAETRGLSKNTGARMLRGWARAWVERRELPTSNRGKHGKSFSLFEDPAIRAQIRSFLRTNKWAMDPEKLAKFSKNELIEKEAKKYLQHIVDVEMPAGLKRYLEVELFPRIHMKVGKGISLSTARRWLRKEGFTFMEHKKGLYFDGHERPDVVEYRQDEFLPAMKKYRERLVEYEVGNVDAEVVKVRKEGERKLVLVAHDEMTAQANDGKKKSWVLEGEQPLRKKGVGRGLHQSDVICSTHGWLPEASQTLEYGKNYDGYWNGELFVKQVEDAIRVLENRE